MLGAERAQTAFRWGDGAQSPSGLRSTRTTFSTRAPRS